MLKQFETFMKQREAHSLFSFEENRWESEHGEVFLWTKDLKTELSRLETWILCLSAEGRRKGIAMLKNEDSEEATYLFFTEHLFLQTFFPVLFLHPQCFDHQVHPKYVFVVPNAQEQYQ